MPKPKSKPDPLKSLGARLERKAVRAYLRRQKKLNTDCAYVLQLAIDWVLSREKRYSKRQGGL